MEKATFKDLIARKMQKENDKHKFKEIEVKSIGKSLIFKKPSDDTILDIINDIGDGQDIRKAVEGYKKLIYLTCETLQDTELQNGLGVVDPFDTVGEIFDLADIIQIGEGLIDFIGFETASEEIKNS